MSERARAREQVSERESERASVYLYELIRVIREYVSGCMCLCMS
jgi:hypothetical protein